MMKMLFNPVVLDNIMDVRIEIFKKDEGLEIFLDCEWFRVEPTYGTHVASICERRTEPHL